MDGAIAFPCDEIFSKGFSALKDDPVVKNFLDEEVEFPINDHRIGRLHPAIGSIWFEERDVKHGMDLPRRWKVKFVGYRSNSF